MLLKRGSSGDDVKKLQQKLGLSADGFFGAGTEAKVKEWQTTNGLTADGIVGSGTWTKMFGEQSETPTTQVVIAKIDNLKFVETDMIPFFLLGTESRINQKVQTPLGAVAPFIDFGETEFAFLDLLEISETIFSPLQNPTVVVTPNNTVTYTAPGGIKASIPGEEALADVGIAPGISPDLSVGGGSSVFNPGGNSPTLTLGAGQGGPQKAGGETDRFGNPISGAPTLD